VDTILGYVRLYDGTVATDYYRAMGQVKNLIQLPQSQSISVSAQAGLLALVDSLDGSRLDENQRATVQALKQGIISLMTY
jgi:hypothetical protein